MSDKIILMKTLRRSKFGLTITELVKQTKLTRSNVRMCLAYLIGSNEINYRNIGMAKVYSVNKKSSQAYTKGTEALDRLRRRNK